MHKGLHQRLVPGSRLKGVFASGREVLLRALVPLKIKCLDFGQGEDLLGPQSQRGGDRARLQGHRQRKASVRARLAI